MDVLDTLITIAAKDCWYWFPHVQMTNGCVAHISTIPVLQLVGLHRGSALCCWTNEPRGTWRSENHVYHDYPWFYHKSPLPWQDGSGSKAMADCQTNQIDHLNSQVSLRRSFDRQVLPYRHTCLWPKKIAVATAGVSSTHYQPTHCIASKKSMRFNRIEDIFVHWTFCIQGSLKKMDLPST